MKIAWRVACLFLAATAVVAPFAGAAERSAAPKLPSPKETWLLTESPSFTVMGNVSA